MTALTTTQLDELEANARGELTEEDRCVPIDADITLQLVAIARAALAWRDAKQSAVRPVVTEEDRQLIVALRGTP